MNEYLQLLQTSDGVLLALIIFSSGIGIGAAVIQIFAIKKRQANDAATSVVTWALLLTFSLTAVYYLWHNSEQLILPLLLGVLAFAAAIGLFVSFSARKQLAAVEAARQAARAAGHQQTSQLEVAAAELRNRLQEARQAR